MGVDYLMIVVYHTQVTSLKGLDTATKVWQSTKLEPKSPMWSLLGIVTLTLWSKWSTSMDMQWFQFWPKSLNLTTTEEEYWKHAGKHFKYYQKNCISEFWRTILTFAAMIKVPIMQSLLLDMAPRMEWITGLWRTHGVRGGERKAMSKSRWAPVELKVLVAQSASVSKMEKRPHRHHLHRHLPLARPANFLHGLDHYWQMGGQEL